MGNLPEFEASEAYMARVEILAEHEQEYSTVKKDAIHSIITVLQIGLQNTEELLSMHDASLGRTTPKNKSAAEQLEKEIDSIKEQIKELKEIVGK